MNDRKIIPSKQPLPVELDGWNILTWNIGGSHPVLKKFYKRRVRIEKEMVEKYDERTDD